jgi:hypothetical protein
MTEIGITLRVSQELARKSSAAAALHGWSRAELIRRLMEQFLTEDEFGRSLWEVDLGNGRRGQQQEAGDV